MLPFLDDYLHMKNLRYQLIPFKDIDDQRILKYDYTRGTLAQSKVVVSDATFPQ